MRNGRPILMWHPILCLLLGALILFGPAKGIAAGSDTAKTSGDSFGQLREKDSIRSPVIKSEKVRPDKALFEIKNPSGLRYQPLTVKILVGFFALFFVLVALFLTLILGLRIRKTIQLNRAKLIEGVFREFVLEIIFMEEVLEPGENFSRLELDKIDDYERDHLTNPFQRTVVLNLMLQLHKNLSGETAVKLKDMFLYFHFDEDSRARLKKKKWYIKAKAIKELEQMNILTAYRDIYRCINHKNETLRSEAQMAIINLKKNNHLSFLSKLEDEMSDWQQLNILGRLVNVKNLKTTDIPKLLESANQSVVILTLKIIQYFNLMEYGERLKNMYLHAGEKIKTEVVKCLSFLEVEGARELLMGQFESESLHVQIEIIQSMGSLGLLPDILWLESSKKSGNLQLIHAANVAIDSLRNALGE